MPKQTTTEKAAATPAKKTASRKKVVFTLQFAGKELTVAEMEALAVAAWMEQTGGLKKDAKDIQLYAKPEDSMLYYVINGESGSVALSWNQQTTQKPVCGSFLTDGFFVCDFQFISQRFPLRMPKRTSILFQWQRLPATLRPFQAGGLRFRPAFR